ncbi:MAG: NgoFVII family restriction endonuclease [Methanomicrobiales archaeon HGW-Methanomicrobiales-3]|jgi:superfamily II DNA or RNA helicase|nr:MAG: NgoFVII family restriction endonuclease [Methanomicrobiales archaeon HGW-Methanomicrobiales-3]
MKSLPHGLYEQLINTHLEEKLRGQSISKDSLKNFDSSVLLAQYLGPVLKKSLEFLEDSQGSTIPEQIACCNEIIRLLATITNEECLSQCTIPDDGEILLSIGNDTVSPSRSSRPVTPLSQSSLFTGSALEPSLIQELKAEILSADRIDILVSFIKWSGIRLLMDELKTFSEQGGRLRVITTAYTGATDIRAIDFLSSLPNTEVRISYDTAHTRLHAKAYYFERDSGFSTAYVGSSNISNPAITSGLEWNVKLTEKDSKPLIRKIQASFDSYWNDPEFLRYQEKDRATFEEAVRKERRGSADEGMAYFFDIIPFPFQKEILERLVAERTIHNRYKNLVVAATGTGKTVISAFDFKRFREKNPQARLLFVAHREEILKQSLHTFRGILKDQNFGDIAIAGKIPAQVDHLFMSIQTFNSSGFSDRTPPGFYDFLIVDEFHHAAAASYQRLLSHYTPAILLGLTATPERMDNLDILGYFDGRIAAEIRLAEAIGRNLLAPFHYFGVADSVDLDDVEWTRGRYNQGVLSKRYTGNDERAGLIADSIRKYVTDIDEIIGLGFCVSIEHAKYMAEIFTKIGIPSLSLSSDSPDDVRRSVQQRLRAKEIRFIFVVDLYNEGVDIPEVNTILFLRPTESMTVFLQQLGRGLRLNEGKECLTVLDFVGRQHANYHFDAKYRALLADARVPVVQQIRENAFSLPRGCFITLEKVAQQKVLEHIERALTKWKGLVQKVGRFEAESGKTLDVRNFLEYLDLEPREIYGRSSFRRLCAEANLCEAPTPEEEGRLTTTAKRLLPLNSVALIRFIRQSLATKDFTGTSDPRRDSCLAILYYSFHSQPLAETAYPDLLTSMQPFLEKDWMVREIDSLLAYLEDKTEVLEAPLDLGFPTGLSLHCTYSRDQVFAGLGHWIPEKINVHGKREGVLYLREKNLDVFFITLNKSEKHFSPSTMYNDYAISERLFHWQSQSTTSASSPTGQRYISGSSKVLLFVREFNKVGNVSQPFVCLGTARYVSHTGSKPMSIVWRLDAEIPAGVMRMAGKGM